MKSTRIVLAALAGPLAALAVTWHAGLIIANTPAGPPPAPGSVSQLRSIPDGRRLTELAGLGVLYPRFDDMPAAEVLAIAGRMFAGGYAPEGVDALIRVPFEPAPYLSGRSTWHLDIQSFWTPALLGRAYELSGKPEYITAAVQYIIDWGKHESSLWVPRGYFFNDHALAARTLVLSEIWRLYRASEAYQPRLASGLLHYAHRLSRLLLEERLYEYRSNHGVMQCLALMHLATAFPLLEGFDRLFDTGWKRLELQLGYFINAEGVILEHSPGYQVDGMKMLGAAWRLLGMNGRAVPPTLADRYRKARAFSAALRRPDDTLPPIGDTHGTGHFPLRVADLDAAGVVATPLRALTAAELEPDPLTLAAGAGYVIVRNDSAQTVLHWGNFPTAIHKHADELGLSLWAGGLQWVRGIGYWPYIASRRAAVGWRSTNAPHWLGEPAGSVRSSSLLFHASDRKLALFDVLRSNADGGRVRRQVVRLDPGTWVVLDSFESPHDATGEILWHFAPELTLKSLAPGQLELSTAGQAMRVLITGASPPVIEADENGTRPWNTGVVSHGEIVPSPAIRIQTGDHQGPVASLFSLHGPDIQAGTPASATLRWNGPADWTVDLLDAHRNLVSLQRTADRVLLGGADTPPVELPLSAGQTTARSAAMNQALGAYEEAFARYGIPFEVRLERRLKVTGAILLCLLLQIGLFMAVARYWRRGSTPMLMTSSVAWLALCLFLHLRFLAMD